METRSVMDVPREGNSFWVEERREESKKNDRVKGCVWYTDTKKKTKERNSHRQIEIKK